MKVLRGHLNALPIGASGDLVKSLFPQGTTKGFFCRHAFVEWPAGLLRREKVARK